MIIFSFGNIGAYDLLQSENPSKFLSVRELLKIHLEKENDEEISNLIDNFCNILIKHRNMLWDYFSIKILSNLNNEGKKIFKKLF